MQGIVTNKRMRDLCLSESPLHRRTVTLFTIETGYWQTKITVKIYTVYKRLVRTHVAGLSFNAFRNLR
jgi:hypothetical protein